MKRILLISLLGFLLSAPSFAMAQFAEAELPLSPDGKGFVAPFILMTPFELNLLTPIQRSAYLDQVRNLLSKAPESWSLAEKSECGRTKKQCEPSLFGENVCISKRESAHQGCVARAMQGKDFSVQAWGGYYARLQKSCLKSKMPSPCQSLGKARLARFP